MSGPPPEPDVGVLRAAWRCASDGSPAVVRFRGDPSRGLEELADHLIPEWAVDQVPEGSPAILWFAAGAAAEAAADVCISAVLLLQIPWLIVVSGPHAMTRGVPFGIEIEGGGEGAVRPTQVTGLEIGDTPAAIEAQMLALARDGRIAAAAAVQCTLQHLDPDRASPHRWLQIARSFYLMHRDTLEVARQAMGIEGSSSRVLTFAGQAAVGHRTSVHLLRRAIRRAETDEERADARYYLNRAEVTAGIRSSRDCGEPGHRMLVAQARFGPASRSAYRNNEPGPEHHALDAVGTALARSLAQWVHQRYQTGFATRDGVFRSLLGLGMLRTAAWAAVEGAQMPEGAHLVVGLEALGHSRMLRAVRLSELITDFDAERALRLAPQLLHADNNSAIRSFGLIVVCAAKAVLHDDPRALAPLLSSEVRDQLQVAFCEILDAASQVASPVIRARLLALAADWSTEIAGLSERRQVWLETLRNSDLDHIPLGSYTLSEPLSQGTMGGVWRGEHMRLEHPVAVKFVLRAALKHAAAFEEEVEVLASLDHPAVVQVLDVGEVTEATEALSGGVLVAGTPYIVMEYVSGGTLTSYRGTLLWSDVRALLLALLDALAYIHARGILHRDLKPQNVLIGRSDEGLYVRLSDFGLSVGRMRHKVAGTPTYMAPEQFTGVGMGPWSDLYAVGCVATALLSGLPPFIGSTKRLARAHRLRPVPPLETPIALPEGFERWRLRLLEKAPEDRFPTARAASLALRGLPAVESPQATHKPSVELTHASFVFETMVGMPETAPPPLTPSQTSFRTLLPADGLVQRSIRSRLPTDRLFGRFPTPCLGQDEVLQALWTVAFTAYETDTIGEIAIGVPLGMDLARVLRWTRRRLRELGVHAMTDDSGDFQLSEHTPPYPPGVIVRTTLDRALSLTRLSPMESVAQIRLQVECSQDLAWTLASRAHGLPRLLDELLAEVIQHPGLVPSEQGLVPAAALRDRYGCETRFWSDLVAKLSGHTQQSISTAAALAPGTDVTLDGVPDDLLEGAPGARRLLHGLQVHLALQLEETGSSEAVHRELLTTANTDFARGWHLLGAGEPELAEPLLRTQAHTEQGAQAVNHALDLQLIAVDDPRRTPLPSCSVSPPETRWVDAVLRGDTAIALLEARTQLARLLEAGTQEGRGTAEAVVLTATAGAELGSWTLLLDTGCADWTRPLLQRAIELADRHDDRVARLRTLLSPLA